MSRPRNPHPSLRVMRERRYRARVIARGDCVDCRRPRGPDGTTVRCRACAGICAARVKTYYHARKELAR